MYMYACDCPPLRVRPLMCDEIDRGRPAARPRDCMGTVRDEAGEGRGERPRLTSRVGQGDTKHTAAHTQPHIGDSDSGYD